MATRSYKQLCGLALALDVVGDRWTILIIRELVAGPQRFTDLINGLSGISTNLLTDRLKALEDRGVVDRRTLPPPAASIVYELSEIGRGLVPTLLELGRWGSQFVDEAGDECRIMHLGSYALTPQTFFRPELAAGVDKTYGLHIGGEVQSARIVDQTIDVWQGAPELPDMALHADVPTYLGLLTRQIEPQLALANDMARVEGDESELYRFLEICGM